MARLILLNGAPAAGKSTLARRYADEHPLTLALDLDVVRALLGSWASAPGDAGVLARRMALEMARVHLGSGREVVVPQFLGRLAFVLDLDRLAAECGVPFVEVALTASAPEAASRFHLRGRTPDPFVTGPDDLRAMHERLEQVVAARPATRRVRSVPGDVDATYRALLAALASATPAR